MLVGREASGFHYGDDVKLSQPYVWTTEIQFTYKLRNFFHPYVGRLLELLNRKSLPGLFDRDEHASWRADVFANAYSPTDDKQVILQHGSDALNEGLDVRADGPYAVYN